MNKKKFYDSIRSSITLTDRNVKGFDFIIDEAIKRQIKFFDLCYILATVYHETAATMQPIAEYGKGKGRKYGVKGKYGQVPYGRGYVQLTWDENYEKADKKLKLNGALLKNFDLAMDPKIAVQILFIGMEEGWFTGKKLSDYIDNIDEDDKEDLREFANARRIINGTDKQILIGNYALVFEKALKAAGYPLNGPYVPTERLPDDPGVPVPPKVEKPSASQSDLLTAILEILKKLFGGKNV